ncbi:MAG: tyrosine-type recombinase/integrase [Eubacterium sp.]|nr:tyrosine-type recombinase/integrase [Eubacterium sp.]
MSVEINNSIDVISRNVLSYLEEKGYTSKSIKHYRLALKRLKHYYEDLDKPYSEDLTLSHVSNLEERYNNKEISILTFRVSRRTAIMANEFFRTGFITINDRRVTKAATVQLSEANHLILTDYLDYLHLRNLKQSTIKNNKNDVSIFLHFFESIEKPCISELTNADIALFIPFLSKSKPDSIGNSKINDRNFLKYLNEKGIVNDRIPESLNMHFSRPHRIHYGFSSDEINKLLSSVDTTTNLGKRDYAILVLASKTGLRSIDISNLNLWDIKWEQGEIHVVQSKTQKPLILPLMHDVGNAIADYILNARPKTSDQAVFLSNLPPYHRIRNFHHIVEKYADLSGIRETTKAQLSIHSFRRSLGVNLLNANVPVSTISEILGHTHENATKKYIALDIENLRMCAMPMDNFISKEVIS